MLKCMKELWLQNFRLHLDVLFNPLTFFFLFAVNCTIFSHSTPAGIVYIGTQQWVTNTMVKLREMGCKIDKGLYCMFLLAVTEAN